MPANKDFCVFAETIVNEDRFTAVIKELGAIAERWTSPTVCRAVHCKTCSDAGCLFDFHQSSRPVIPSRAVTRHFDARILKKGYVNERTSHGELRHPAVNTLIGTTGLTEPWQSCAIGCFPCCAIYIGCEIKVVLVQTAKVCNPCNVRRRICLKLVFQLVTDDIVTNRFQFHGMTSLFGKRRQHACNHVTFVGVLVA